MPFASKEGFQDALAPLDTAFRLCTCLLFHPHYPKEGSAVLGCCPTVLRADEDARVSLCVGLFVSFVWVKCMLTGGIHTNVCGQGMPVNMCVCQCVCTGHACEYVCVPVSFSGCWLLGKALTSL